MLKIVLHYSANHSPQADKATTGTGQFLYICGIFNYCAGSVK